MRNLTPREIVAELDKYIIGQDDAKRAVAIAVRNRWRRRQLDPDFADEVSPKNILMVGPTGVGKTEIARRLANLTGAPFIKVEASKYTEVGYHGRDVESMIRDLLEIAISMARSEHADRVKEDASRAVEERLVGILMGAEREESPLSASDIHGLQSVGVDVGTDDSSADGTPTDLNLRAKVRERMLTRLRDGFFDDKEIEITINERQAIPIIGMMGPDQMDPAMASMLENLVPERSRRRKVTVARARAILHEEETGKLIDNEKILEQATERTEESGIIFLAEIDKIATPGGKAGEGGRGGPDVSRQGVQRDLLPIVEGSAVATRHGVVHTDGILFIAAGAFHSAAVSDLMPELQGRFPIRVELSALTKDDFRRILIEPKAALTVQQSALLETEGLSIEYEPGAVDAMAELAAEANSRMENIGARRLMTIIERVFEDISFDAPEMAARNEKHITITADFVRERLKPIMKDEDLSRFVL